MTQTTPTTSLRVERDPAGRLVVHLPDQAEPIRGARVARCFPWSCPAEYVSIRNGDGKEIAMLKTLDELDHHSRSIVERELREHVFNPRIQTVLSVKQEFGVATVRARTDRGEVSFQIRSRDDVRTLSPTRAIFRDVDGNSYELTDVTALDSASRKHMEPYF